MPAGVDVNLAGRERPVWTGTLRCFTVLLHVSGDGGAGILVFWL